MELYILGGRPCSSKTTLSYYLGKQCKIDVFYLDTFAQSCVKNATALTHNIYRWKDRELVDLMQKEPHILFDEYLGFYEEMFPLLEEKLLSIDKDKLIIEASILLPKFIRRLKENFEVRVCYLLTTDVFVEKKYSKRDYVKDMITKPNGRVALDNLLRRDSIFAKYICDELKKYSYPKLDIIKDNDISQTVEELKTILCL